MTACPLDCYDACQVVWKEGKLRAGSDAVTQGHLCVHLNRYDHADHLTKAHYQGSEITLDQACETLIEHLKKSDPKKVLLYRGSGNVGKMQAVTDLFFSSYGAALTKGSLCDAAGQAGIIEGRGFNEVIEPAQIEKSEVVVVWGRNIEHTNEHLLRSIEGKKLIVIDPVKTGLAVKADLHIQIKPRGDFYLAMLLSRFAMMEELEDKEYIEAYVENFEWFFDYCRSIRIKHAMHLCGVQPSELYAILSLIAGHKTVFIVGNSVQKYTIGSSVLRAIDSLAVLLGLMGKEGCGVSFLGDTSLGIESPFKVKPSRSEPKATARFEDYDLIIFQGSNALESMPDSARVRKSLEGKTVVYFGLHENETAKRADLVIPAQNFLAKNDLRFSYLDHSVKKMEQAIESSEGISEYALTKRLCEAFDLPLKEESYYLDSFLDQCEATGDHLYRVKNRAEIAYAEGFESEEGGFSFIEEGGDLFKMPEDAYFLITPKSKKALNTMFERPQGVHLHPDLGFSAGEQVRISSDYGSESFEVVLDDRLRPDTILIYANTPKVNELTPSKLSDEGYNAVYQELSITIEKI